jgi:hypothetical protein
MNLIKRLRRRRAGGVVPQPDQPSEGRLYRGDGFYVQDPGQWVPVFNELGEQVGTVWQPSYDLREYVSVHWGEDFADPASMRAIGGTTSYQMHVLKMALAEFFGAVFCLDVLARWVGRRR